jgi:isocitrate/isopropylmalate dehydrogenase
MFEPVHGSAPDIVGRGTANPMAQMLSGVMMLEFLGEKDAASALEKAVLEVLAARRDVTPDLGGTGTTARVTASVLSRLNS